MTTVTTAEAIGQGAGAARAKWGTYRPLAPGGRRRWVVNGEEIMDPHWDPAVPGYVGTYRHGHWQWARPVMTPELAWQVASQIHGWCRPAQGRRLYQLAAAAAGPVVEIGAAWGLSACWLGLAARDRRIPVTCVDTFGRMRPYPPTADPHAMFTANMTYAGLNRTVTAVKTTSLQAAAGWGGGRIALCYIDGGHTERAVRADYHAWRPHLGPGSVLAFDDCLDSYPGIMALQHELAASPDVQLIGRTDAMLAWRLQSAPP